MGVFDFPQLQIEPLSEAKIAAACVFLHDNWKRTYQHQLPGDIVDQRTPEYFQRYLLNKQDLAWLACLGERVVGLVTVASNCIEDIWVEQKYQRRKIGSKLHDIAIEHFNQKGFNSAQVGFESFNHAARKFFQSLDWTIIGSDYVSLEPGKRIEALVYSTRLSASVGERSY
ncbi:MAG: GNAT family N-acetyltransferase [Gammaproteobacteria bacterium]|nr:GNAT family N-acetyltransferase [Gammaproteobacteria bacterium]